MEKARRVLLKLSGEALSGEKKSGLDEATVRKGALQVAEAKKDGAEIGIVIGGGNFWRGRESNAIDRTKADQIGMLATVINCIYVSEVFRGEGIGTEICTPFAIGAFTHLYSKDFAMKALSEGKVVFFAGGTGKQKTEHVPDRSGFTIGNSLTVSVVGTGGVVSQQDPVQRGGQTVYALLPVLVYHRIRFQFVAKLLLFRREKAAHTHSVHFVHPVLTVNSCFHILHYFTASYKWRENDTGESFMMILNHSSA